MNEEIEKVTEEVAENVDAQATEEIEDGIELTDTPETEETVEETKEEQPKGRFMTDEDIDKLVMKKVNRRMSKFEAQKEKELSIYRDTENVLKATLGANDMIEANKKLRDGFVEQGIDLPEPYKAGLTTRETEILAQAEANDYIEDGYEAMVEEANRLANKKYENLNQREKIIFDKLCQEIRYNDEKVELSKLGLNADDVLKDEEFIKFREQFKPTTPISTIYSVYNKQKPKPKVEPIGSMKSTAGDNSGIKDFYTPEEADKFTRKDYDKNPALLKAVENSMPKWYKK